MVNYVRWCFNVTQWKPSKEEWLKLTSSIAGEELERINKFVFQDDSKSSIIGWALIKKFVSEATSTPSNELVFTRSERGRPLVSETYRLSRGNSWPHLLDFNVSHSGDYCVIAGVWSPLESPRIKVGIDVTKIVKKETRQDLDRFLSLMSRREFTRTEWETVEKASSDRQKCINFTRLWCLKESYIKAIGLGLAFKLDRIDFRFSERHNLNIPVDTLGGSMLCDTAVLLDGLPAPDWRFCETALDDEHIVALAYNITNHNGSPINIPLHAFEELSIGSIVDSLEPMTAPDEFDWSHFSSKGMKTF